MVGKLVISSVESASRCQRTRHFMKNPIICTEVTQRANPSALLFRSPIVSSSMAGYRNYFFSTKYASCSLSTGTTGNLDFGARIHPYLRTMRDASSTVDTESSEFLNTLVGRFPLFCGHARYNFWKENCKELPTKLVLEEAPAPPFRVGDIET